jgi:hypothetical protein
MVAAAQHHVRLAGEAEPEWQMLAQQSIQQMPIEPSDELLLELMSFDAVPIWLFERIAAIEDPQVRRAIASSPSALAALRERLQRMDAAPTAGASDPGPAKAATNTHPTDGEAAQASPELLAQLAADEDPQIRTAVARNSATPSNLLIQMKEQEDWSDSNHTVYAAIAANPNTPPELLAHFAADQSALNTGVRRMVAQNPNTPASALEYLADEIYAPDIRRAVACHPNLQETLHAKLLRNTLIAALHSGEVVYRAMVLAHPQFAALQAQANERVPGWRPEACLELETWARSPLWLERCAVAHNPSAPDWMLALLTNDGNRLVRAAAQDALNVPTFQRILQRERDESTRSGRIPGWAGSPQSQVKHDDLGAAGHWQVEHCRADYPGAQPRVH